MDEQLAEIPKAEWQTEKAVGLRRRVLLELGEVLLQMRRDVGLESTDVTPQDMLFLLRVPDEDILQGR